MCLLGRVALWKLDAYVPYAPFSTGEWSPQPTPPSTREVSWELNWQAKLLARVPYLKQRSDTV